MAPSFLCWVNGKLSCCYCRVCVPQSCARRKLCWGCSASRILVLPAASHQGWLHVFHQPVSWQPHGVQGLWQTLTQLYWATAQSTGLMTIKLWNSCTWQPHRVQGLWQTLTQLYQATTQSTGLLTNSNTAVLDNRRERGSVIKTNTAVPGNCTERRTVDKL